MDRRSLQALFCAPLIAALSCVVVVAQERVTAADVPMIESPATVEVVQAEEVGERIVFDARGEATLEAGISAADEIFRAGKPRNAARQYAVLSLRFGASEQLLARRFVAQVAAGEFEQASVIVSLARLMDMKITTESLPAGSLLGFGIDPIMAEELSEALAEMTVLHRIDPLRLEVIAIWLRLSGEVDRSQLFFDKAEEIRAAESRTVERVRVMQNNAPLRLPSAVAPPAITPPADVSVDEAATSAAGEGLQLLEKTPAESTKPSVSLVEPLRSSG